MEGDDPTYVEAVAVKDGLIAHVGTRDQALATIPGARQIDLEGRTMLFARYPHSAILPQEDDNRLARIVAAAVELEHFLLEQILQPEANGFGLCRDCDLG